MRIKNTKKEKNQATKEASREKGKRAEWLSTFFKSVRLPIEKERKTIVSEEDRFSADLQGLSKPKPAFPLGEGRVRVRHGTHRIIR